MVLVNWNHERLSCTVISSTVLQSSVVIEALVYTIPVKEATQHPSDA